jgi:hypothetical protein
MPITRLLKGSVFQPEEVRELTRVYREVITALALNSPAEQEEAAKTIFLIASHQQPFDLGKIEDQAIAVLRR